MESLLKHWLRIRALSCQNIIVILTASKIHSSERFSAHISIDSRDFVQIESSQFKWICFSRNRICSHSVMIEWFSPAHTYNVLWPPNDVAATNGYSHLFIWSNFIAQSHLNIEYLFHRLQSHWRKLLHLFESNIHLSKTFILFLCGE